MVLTLIQRRDKTSGRQGGTNVICAGTPVALSRRGWRWRGKLQVGNGIRVRSHTACQSLTVSAAANEMRSPADPDTLKAAGLAPRLSARQPDNSGPIRRPVLERNKEREMSRREGRYTWKANSKTSGVGRQSRQAEASARASGRLSAHTGRRRLSVTGADSVSGMTPERHDWLVPMELQ